jgi:hypothetical protein
MNASRYPRKDLTAALLSKYNNPNVWLVYFVIIRPISIQGKIFRRFCSKNQPFDGIIKIIFPGKPWHVTWL